MIGGARRLGATGSEGPVKRFKNSNEDGETPPEAPPEVETYEVRFSSADSAEAALQLHGTALEEAPGNSLWVRADDTSKDGTKVIVEGIPAGTACESVKAHFSGVGSVVFAGPPKKGGGGKGSMSGVPGNCVGEVRYETPAEAQQAVGILDGSVIEGCTIGAMIDQSSKDNSKLIVTGLPMGLQWQELKDHCSQGGRVAYANVKVGPTVPGSYGGGGGGCEAEVRYDAPEHAQAAMQQMNGSVLGGRQIWIRADPNSKDHSRLIVTGFPASVQWQELKDHFSVMGTVAFAQVRAAGPQAGAEGAHRAMTGGGQDVYPGGWGGKPIMAMAGKGKLGKPPMAGPYGKPFMVAGGKNVYYETWYGAALAAAFSPWGAGRPVTMATAGKGSRGGGWTGTNGGLGSGEVRYDDPSHASLAIAKLHGSVLQGATLSVSADETSQDNSKVVVHGIPSGCMWQELKDHFGQVGQVAFASIVGPGEVRMETPEEAANAVSLLNGAEVLGSVISVNYDKSSKDGTRLVVNNLPSSVNWQQMKDIFGQAGTVAFATRLEARN